MRRSLLDKDGVVVNVVELPDGWNQWSRTHTWRPPAGLTVADNAPIGWRRVDGKMVPPEGGHETTHRDDASRRSPLAAAVHGVIDRLRALAGKPKVTRTGLRRNTKRTSRR